MRELICSRKPEEVDAKPGVVRCQGRKDVWDALSPDAGLQTGGAVGPVATN
jgi:hypothetical protein